MRRLSVLAFGSVLAFLTVLIPAQWSNAENQINATGSVLAAASGRTCAISNLGYVSCWGYNPTAVPKDLGKVTQISAGMSNICVLDVQWKVRCWGSDRYGLLEIPANLGIVTQVSVGSTHICVLTFTQQVSCWGNGEKGRTAVPSDLGKALQVIAADSYSCAVTVQGSVRCWGLFPTTREFTNWQLWALRQSTISQISVRKNIPCYLSSGYVSCAGSLPYENGITQPQEYKEGFIGEFSQVSAGGLNTCALTFKGDPKCWGPNNEGESLVPTDLGKITQVSAGTSHTCAVNNQGLVKCWGANVWASNHYGQTEVPADFVALPQAKLTSQSIPVIIGKPIMGAELTGVASPWDSGSSLIYEWLRNGVPIENATSKTYKLGFQDFGANISLRVTGVKQFFESDSRVSTSIKVSRFPAGAPCKTSEKTIPLETTVPSKAPSISGKANFGETLLAKNGSWPTGTKFCVFWMSGSFPIPKSSSNSYVIQGTDIDKEIRFVAVGTKGSSSSVRISSPVVGAEGVFKKAVIPTIKGSFRMGEGLVASLPTWDSKVEYSYEWLRWKSPAEGGAIVGYAESYVPNTFDFGARLQVQICGFKRFYKLTCLKSAESAPIQAGLISKVGEVSISGPSPVAYSILSGTSTPWMTGVSLKYQWFLNGTPINNAKSAQLVVQPEYKGGTLSLQVTGSMIGYETTSKMSTGVKVP